MVKNVRVTYRRRHAYATKSNKIEVVKTPGGRLVAHYLKKHASGAKCGDCPSILHGVAHARPGAFKKLHASQKTVYRAYGGSLCGTCVRQRIVRAFLIEEQKIVKRVLQEKLRKKKTA